MTTQANIYPIYEKEHRANPHPIYRQMREENPVWRSISPFDNPVWFITRYEDVVNALKDPRLVRDARKNLPPEIVERYMPLEPDPVWAMINQHVLNMDIPDHTRLRSLVHKAFTPRRIRDLEPRIQQITDDLIQQLLQKDGGDLISEFAFPVPITVIAEIIGVEKERREDFRHWTKTILFNPDQDGAKISVMELVQYMNQLIEERRDQDTGDILSALVRLEEDGDTLSHAELLSMIFVLLVAGHETTVNLIATGMLLLMQHPEQLAALQNDRELMQTAVEEIVRFKGPLESSLIRFAADDIEINGVTIPKGDLVRPSLMAANRDPEVFEDPDVFDIARNPNPHVGYGHGIHYCLGAPLARMEGMIALSALLDHVPDIQLATDPDNLVWSDNMMIYGMQTLPTTW